MAIVEKKCWPELFQAVLRGKKKFDLRLDDFEIKEGDTLVLKEFNPLDKKFTGRVLEKKVNYILKTKDLSFWSPDQVNKTGFQVIGF